MGLEESHCPPSKLSLCPRPTLSPEDAPWGLGFVLCQGQFQGSLQSLILTLRKRRKKTSCLGPYSPGGGGVDLVRPSSTQLTKPFCRAITGGAVGNGDWAVALRQTFKRLKSESEGKKGREETGRPAYLLGEVDEGNVRLGLGTVLVEARPCALEMAASL